MDGWVIRGLKTGIVTTKYPDETDTTPGISPGFPSETDCSKTNADKISERCPTGALKNSNEKMYVNHRRCIHCYRCLRNVQNPMDWKTDFEWATVRGELPNFPEKFKHSLHIRVVDSGDCGACLNEVKLLNNPFYNMHRLGFFITPTPRKADILLVVGPVTDHMKPALLKAYEAMPTPKRVMAVGTCALTGGIFENSFVTEQGVNDIIPVNIEIPGCPPPPLAILHGLLVLAGVKEQNIDNTLAEKTGGNNR